jgi:sulfite exporter TauE/SafE
MALFGFATTPALIGLTLGAARLVPALSARRLRTVSGVLVLGCALWTGLGGMAHRSHMHPGLTDATVLRLPDRELPSRPAAAPVTAPRVSTRQEGERGGPRT